MAEIYGPLISGVRSRSVHVQNEPCVILLAATSAVQPLASIAAWGNCSLTCEIRGGNRRPGRAALAQLPARGRGARRRPRGCTGLRSPAIIRRRPRVRKMHVYAVAAAVRLRRRALRVERRRVLLLPPITVLLLAGFLRAAIGPFASWIDSFLRLLIEEITGVVLNTVVWVDGLWWSSIQIHGWPLWATFLWLICLVLWTRFRLRDLYWEFRQRWTRRRHLKSS